MKRIYEEQLEEVRIEGLRRSWLKRLYYSILDKIK